MGTPAKRKRTVAEEDYIRRHAPTMSIGRMASNMGREPSLVGKWMRQMDVRPNYEWSQKALDFLEDHPDMTSEEISNVLGRTKKAVQKMRDRLQREIDEYYRAASEPPPKPKEVFVWHPYDPRGKSNANWKHLSYTAQLGE